MVALHVLLHFLRKKRDLRPRKKHAAAHECARERKLAAFLFFYTSDISHKKGPLSPTCLHLRCRAYENPYLYIL